jgi:hypothetical protein
LEWFSITPRCRPFIPAIGRLVREVIESVVGLQERLDPLPKLEIAIVYSGRELRRGPWGHDGFQPQEK